ncbi:MAG: BatA domain-containing protein [Candidatus Riflebacteria bacterium]|nr:BatA domain-containing protein [Candidatus Riflebacteria bacterium]
MPVFMSPLAFWGILALAAVAAVYLFRRQSRNIRVSSLMFWSHVKVPAEGGRKITRLQIPLVLVVELMILALLVMAAATPRAITGDQLVPVALILDDSFSMSAGATETSRDRALAWLNQNIFSRQFIRLTLFRAGVEPEIVGRPDMKGTEAAHLIGNWRCNSPSADLNSALRTVSENCSADTRVFVITDRTTDGLVPREPGMAEAARTTDGLVPREPGMAEAAKGTQQALAGNINWLAFGQPLANIAITTANRYALGDVDRCFFEFVNFAPAPVRLSAEILSASDAALIERIDLDLGARAHHRVRLTIKDSTAGIRAVIKNDAIEYDNQAWLLPVRPELVKVETASLSAQLRLLVERTINSSGLATLVDSAGQLAFFENAPTDHGSVGRWNFIIHNATQPVTLRASVAVDKNHPLLAGLPKVTAAWAFDRDFTGAGQPLMSVAGIPLLISSGDQLSAHNIYLNLAVSHSNLHTTPVWPVLFWNLLSWRQQSNPGPAQFNYHSGMEVRVNLPAGVGSIKVTTPAGRVSEIPVWRHSARFAATDPGIHTIQAGDTSWKASVNLNSVEESDLTNLQTHVPDFELAEGDTARYFSDVRWWFIVPALLLMVLHQWLLRQGRPGHVY